MKMLARLALLMAPAAMLTAPLAATPPDAVTVHDSAFAAGDDAIYLLRRTDDNLGLHTATRSEVFLVRVDVASGEEELLPVHAEDSFFEWISDSEIKRSVTPRRTPDMIDPFAHVAEAGATLISWNAGAAASDLPKLRLTDDEAVLRYSDERAHTLPLATARTRALAAMEGLAQEGEARLRRPGQTTADFYRAQAGHAKSCSVGAEGWPARTAKGMVQLLRVTCLDAEMGMPVLSILIPVPQD